MSMTFSTFEYARNSKPGYNPYGIDSYQLSIINICTDEHSSKEEAKNGELIHYLR